MTALILGLIGTVLTAILPAIGDLLREKMHPANRAAKRKERTDDEINDIIARGPGGVDALNQRIDSDLKRRLPNSNGSDPIGSGNPVP